MIAADFQEVIAMLAGGWVIGWCMGYLVYVIRRAADFV